LLISEIEDEEEPRSWSLWNTTDPVALKEGLLRTGLPDYGAEYAGKVFVFENEDN